MIISFAIVLLASFFLGTFGLGMKYNKPLAWEAFWFVHAITGMLIVPTVWALLVVPDLFQSIATAESDAIFRGALYGFIWGMGGVTFGISVQYVGVSLTYGVVMGTTGAIGALVPLFQMGNATAERSFPYIILGVAIMLLGVGIITLAGIRREKLLAESGQEIQGIKKGKDFWKGIAIVSFSGVMSAFINIGFANAQPVAQNAEIYGASPVNASLTAWIVVLWGAIAFNLGYSVILLTRNRTWKSFAFPKSFNAYKWAVIAAILWFGALGAYGLGAAKMGKLGTVIGWPVFVGLSLIFSNIWGIRSGEWKGAEKLIRILVLGVLVLIVATVALAFANTI
jgi:L-rhamnose-H+ transport protein